MSSEDKMLSITLNQEKGAAHEAQMTNYEKLNIWRTFSCITAVEHVKLVRFYFKFSYFQAHFSLFVARTLSWRQIWKPFCPEKRMDNQHILFFKWQNKNRKVKKKFLMLKRRWAETVLKFTRLFRESHSFLSESRYVKLWFAKKTNKMNSCVN